MRHEQSIEFKSMLFLHNRISDPNCDIVRCNRSHNLWNGAEGGISREEMEIMSRCFDDFFIKFVKDGPEMDSKGPIDGWKREFVHDSGQGQFCIKLAEIRRVRASANVVNEEGKRFRSRAAILAKTSAG